MTLADSSSKIVKAFADPVGNGVWVGAYLELASLAAFVVFAAWLFRSQRGVLATAGHDHRGRVRRGDPGEPRRRRRARVPRRSWAWRAVAAGAVRPPGRAVHRELGPRRRLPGPGSATGWLRRSALAIAALALVGMAVPKAAPGQFAACCSSSGPWWRASSSRAARASRRSTRRRSRARSGDEAARRPPAHGPPRPSSQPRPCCTMRSGARFEIACARAGVRSRAFWTRLTRVPPAATIGVQRTSAEPGGQRRYVAAGRRTARAGRDCSDPAAAT